MGEELFLGWDLLMGLRGTDNDGLVANTSCCLEGIPLVYRFTGYGHYDLVLHADVAAKAMQYALP